MTDNKHKFNQNLLKGFGDETFRPINRHDLIMLSFFYTSARMPNTSHNKKVKSFPFPRREGGRYTALIKNKNFSSLLMKAVYLQLAK